MSLNNLPQWMSNFKCPHCKSATAKVTELGVFNDYDEPFRKGSDGNKQGNFFINILCPSCKSFGPIEFRTQIKDFAGFIDFLQNGADVTKKRMITSPF
jgi:phage FluMu protein Com